MYCPNTFEIICITYFKKKRPQPEKWKMAQKEKKIPFEKKESEKPFPDPKMHDTMPLLKITIPYSVLSLGYY
jgi:hypothetical protein